MKLYLTIFYIMVLMVSQAQQVEEMVSQRVVVEKPEIALEKDSVKQQLIVEAEESWDLAQENFASNKQEFIKSYNQALQPFNDSLPKLSLMRNKERLRKRYNLEDSAAVNRKLETMSFSHPDEVSAMLTKELNAVYDAERDGTLMNLKTYDKFDISTVKIQEINWQQPAFPDKKFSADKVVKNGRIKIDTENIKTDELEKKFRNIDPDKALDQLKQEAISMKRVYSEKTLKKIYDSLGLHNMDSMVNAASGLAKKNVTEQELLASVRQSFPDYRDESNSLDTTQLAALQNGDLKAWENELDRDDLSELTLPDSVMDNLPPTRLSDIDSKYLDAIDSMRQLRLKAESLKMNEHEVAEDIKATVIKEKPKFWDKLYIDGIIEVVQNNKGQVFKISPSLGYNLSQTFSIGLGPTIMLDKESNNWNGQLGLRTFVKSEFWKQRVYLQLEDNVNPVKINIDDKEIGKMNHAILFGGGCLLPLSKSIALNPSILYRISQSNPPSTSSSPWVFRLGFSTIGNKKK